MNNNNLKVSNIIDIARIQENKINMIVSGCGTGKSYFAINELHEMLNVRLEEILFVTSRKITKEQQIKEYKNATSIHWSNLFFTASVISNAELKGLGTRQEKIQADRKVHVCTYNWFNEFYFDSSMLEGVKVIVFDEIHALFTDVMYNEAMLNIIKNLNKLMNNHILIGMTATDIELKTNSRIKNHLNYMLDENYYIYKVQNTFNVITKLRYVDNIINNLNGNTLYMSCSSNRAIALANKYNSHAIISTYNKDSNKANTQRETIIKDKLFPPNTNILFCTSCMREGLELKEENQIENIIIESFDPNTIIQFIGRYRKDVKNVYIINNHYFNLKEFQNRLTHNQKLYFQQFKNLIYKNDYTWTKYFSDIVNKDTIEFNIIKDEDIENNFIDYIKSNWLDRLIYTKEDKQTIVLKSKEYGLKRDKNHNHTFNSLMKYLSVENFIIEKNIKKVKGIRYTNYIIK